ncbi:MAG TPA: DUF748 domain-containing protein, partial [Trinickia sp.]|uniref:DUF748 domain-containing protein n=1 Tax=Trinickia sp. TaxID=2571163 RepID=UPI002BCF132E
MSSETKAGMTKTLVKVREATRSRRARHVAVVGVVAIAIYGLLGFFVAPPLIRHIAEGQLSDALGRPTRIERVALNPYTLRLELDRLHVANASGAGDLISAERLFVRLSWFSLLRFAPIVTQVKLDSPRANIVRYEAQRFNFSDIVEKFSKPSKPSKPSTGPALFSVSNIDVENGRIDFDDRLTGVKHVIDQLSLGVPFIATLPSKTDIFVDPRFSARIDGSPLRIVGKTKPFVASRESDVELKFADLDVPQLWSYAPARLPVKVQDGKLAGDLSLHFVMTGTTPALTVTGTLDLANANIVDAQGAPFFAARSLQVAADSLEPLRQIYHFDTIRLDQPSLHLSRDHAGELNVTGMLVSSSAAPRASAGAALTTPSASSASDAAATGQPAAPLDLAIKHFELNDGAIALDDHVPRQPVSLGLTQLSVALDDVATLSKAPARFNAHTALAQGGTLSATGSFGIAAKTADAKIVADALPLALVEPYLSGVTAARIDAGTLGSNLALKADWSKAPFDVQVGQSNVTLKSVKVTGPPIVAERNAPAPAIALDEGQLVLNRIDLAERKADIASVDVTGLSVTGARSKDGRIDLAALAAAPGGERAASGNGAPREEENHGRRREALHREGELGAKNASTAAGGQPGWRYTIGELNLKNGTLEFVDQTPLRPATVRLSSIQLNLRGLSDDIRRPLPVKLAAMLNGKGSLEASGTVSPSPLEAALTLHANRLDVAPLAPYIGESLRATVASALLSAWGDVKVADGNHGMSASYRGGAALLDVRLLDPANSQQLAGWRSLAVSGANVRYGRGDADIDIGRITFSQFSGGVLLDSQGRLNINAVLHHPPAETPESVTHRDSSTVATNPRPAPAASQRPPVRVRIGEIVLQQGHVTYTDNFIKPNYSGNLVDITGTIGAFGTDGRESAPVDVSARLARNGPMSIRGTVNPLAQKPSLDLSASAHDIQLQNLTPYSLKYAGYPVTKGTLNVDLQYKLADDVLKANNHIFVSQLTFGEHVENDTATKLPVKLAIALLKNRRGEIDVNIPVSGSLSNPEFSLGGLIWSAVLHLVEKAVTAPFTLLANALGGGDSTAAEAEQLKYVVFSPGSTALSTATRGKMDTIAKLLADKTEVKLELTGCVDPAIDTPGLRLAYVDDLVRQQKARAQAGQSAHVDASNVKVDKSEYSDYLKKAYREADFDKPRNFIGLTK